MIAGRGTAVCRSGRLSCVNLLVGLVMRYRLASDIITREEVRLTVVRVGSARREERCCHNWKHTFAARRRSSRRSINRGLFRTIGAAWRGNVSGRRVPRSRVSPAAPWMAYHGRFPPAAVLEIAQQVLAGLIAWEQAGLLHSDLGANQLLIDDEGTVRRIDWRRAAQHRAAERDNERSRRTRISRRGVFDYLARAERQCGIYVSMVLKQL